MATVAPFAGRSTPRRMSRRYELFRRCMILLCRVLFGLSIHGIERVPREGPLIVASNHSQYPDPVLVCMAVPRRMQWMAKKQLFVFPYRKLFEFIGSYPVDREGGGRAAIRASLAFLAEEWAIGIFPEGTHHGAEESREAKTGAVVLAVRSGAPVLPVYVGKLPGPLARLRGRTLEIFVGEPLTLDKDLRGGRAYRVAANEIMSSVYALPENAKRAAQG